VANAPNVATNLRAYMNGFSGNMREVLEKFDFNMFSRMKPIDHEGSRVAIVMNGSPLFTGDAGSEESEIRRWILENDWLDDIVALQEQLFYNTGIATYVWILINRKDLGGAD
jgi:type I restriction-modification system DNA methylase subunit